MKRDKIYISGAIGSIDRKLATSNFQYAETKLIEQGYEVINPMKITKPDPSTWKDCMLVDIKYVFECNAIYMLKNWRQSTGARIELSIATELGFKILYEEQRPFDVNFVAMISEKERENFTLT